MERLVEAFRNREKRVEMKHPYEELCLNDTVNVRPSISTYTVPSYTKFFGQLSREVRDSRDASKRIGNEWMPKDRAVIKKRQQDDVWTTREDLKPLDDVCTKFCTLKYFPDAFSRMTMVSNVTKLFSRIGHTFGSEIDVIFKGGVMQRLIILELIYELPISSQRSIIEFLTTHKALSISDLDFELSTHTSSAAIHHRIALMSFLTLVLLQNELNSELMGEVPPRLLSHEWDKTLGKEELKQRLQQEIQSLPNSHPLSGATVDDVGMFPLPHPLGLPHKTRSGKPRPDPRDNLFIFKCGEDTCVADAEKILAELGISMQHLRAVRSEPLYTNLNMYIGEDSEKMRAEHLSSVFHLARIKHTFHLYYTTKSGEKRVDRLNGEMIDMSQSTHRDEMSRLFSQRVPKPYRQYAIVGMSHSVRSYTMLGFLIDIIHTIHHSENEPWKANKLLKRQSRYVAFLVGVLLETLSVKDTAQELQRLHDKLSSTSSQHFVHSITRFVYGYERRMASHSKYLNSFLKNLKTWIKSMENTSSYLNHVNDIHVYQVHKFVTPAKKT